MSRTKNPVAIVTICVVACATLISACARNDPAPAVASSGVPGAAMLSAARENSSSGLAVDDNYGDVPEVVVSAPRPVKPIVLSERGPAVSVD